MKGIYYLSKVPPEPQWVYQYGHEQPALILYRHRLKNFFKKYYQNVCPFSLWKPHFSSPLMKNPFKDETHSREINTAGRCPRTPLGWNELSIHFGPRALGLLPLMTKTNSLMKMETVCQLFAHRGSASVLQVKLAKFLQVQPSVFCPKSYGKIGRKSNTNYLRSPNSAQSWYFSLTFKMENNWKPGRKKKHLPALGKEWNQTVQSATEKWTTKVISKSFLMVFACKLEDFWRVTLLLLRPEAGCIPRRCVGHTPQHLLRVCGPGEAGLAGVWEPRLQLFSCCPTGLEVGWVTSQGGGQCPCLGLCCHDLSLLWLCLSVEREWQVQNPRLSLPPCSWQSPLRNECRVLLEEIGPMQNSGIHWSGFYS